MIPFHTLSQRHLVYAYAAVFCLQFGYAAWLALRWKESAREHAAEPGFEKNQRSQVK